MSDTLTIGMATRGEFDSVYFTLTGLAANHPRCQYLVIDNTPERCPRTEAITKSVGGRYIHRPDLTGTSKPRDAVFRYAQTPWVMCIDSHVVFEHFHDGNNQVSAIAEFLRWLDANKESRDLIQGPMVSDNGVGISTHWRQTAPPGLWGEWDTIWEEVSSGRRFTVHVQDGIITRREVNGGQVVDTRKVVHEYDKNFGWERLSPHGHPLEIQMLGLGCWAMRKDAWPGLSYLSQGFGGEEGYLHEKARQRGSKTILLPFLRWRHKFRDVAGWDKNPMPYPIRLEDHVWNLLVQHRELGVDATEQIYAHFGKRLEAKTWLKILERANKVQPMGKAVLPAKQTLLAVWYTDNTAPADLMSKSLKTIADAKESTFRHDVKIVTVGWGEIAGNPFPFIRYSGERKRSHGTLVKQIQEGMAIHAGNLQRPDAVVCMEHDVLYPANYFDRVGDSLAFNPLAPVISNLDYIGLNETGWLGVKERHEPMHQLTIRWDVMTANLQRAAEEYRRTDSAIVEPNHGEPRANWVKIGPGGNMPSVHVNHKAGRFTLHGEVCYLPTSGGVVRHAYWGDAANWWPGGQIDKPTTSQPQSGCTACEGDNHATLNAWYESVAQKPSDFHEHVKTLKDLADGCDIVAELSTWNKPALIAMAASSAKSVMSYAPRNKTDWQRLGLFCGERFQAVPSLPVQVEPCDLLFLDTAHTMATVYAQLIANADQVSRYFVVHTTSIYGETGDDGTPGVLGAIRKFLAERPEWTSIRNDPNNYGMVVLSRDDRDKKNPPGLFRKALNFAQASAKHAANGLKPVPPEVFTQRIELCVMCPERFHDICGACGCPIENKASWASEECGRVKLGNPAKPPLWGAYTETTAEAVTVGYDMDGTLSTGQFNPSVPFVVISGRLENERAATVAELKKLNVSPVAIYLRSKGGYGDGVAAGEHKAETIKQLNLIEFYEDNVDHVRVIRASNPQCKVVLVGK